MKWTITCGALLLAACDQKSTGDQNDGVAASQEAATVLTVPTSSLSQRVITCHLLMGGFPSPEPTIYELAGTDFYSTAPSGDRRLISSEGKLAQLGHTEDDEGAQDSFASHTVQGHVLTRTVLWQRAGRPPETAFVERYDFRKQTVIDADTGEDTCNHSAPPDGRT